MKTFQLISLALILFGASKLNAQSADWVKISTGGEFTIGLKDDGSLWSWGFNGNGQLGVGNTTQQLVPVQMGTSMDWESISAGAFHAMAIKTDGTLWAWGYNQVGALGINSLIDQLSPVQVGDDNDWQSVELGSYSSYAIKTDGTLWACGFNVAGQLGTGSVDNLTVMTQVGEDSDWQSISAGGYHLLALKNNGTIWSCGNNNLFELGQGDSIDYLNVLTQIGVASDWALISAGFQFCMAIKNDGSLWAWGFGGNGQMGNNSTADQQFPTQIEGNQTWQNVYAGCCHAFGLTNDGSFYSWGHNGFGNLGLGDDVQRNVPTIVAQNVNWQLFDTAKGIYYEELNGVFGLHAIGMQEGDFELCFAGANYVGQLGNGTDDSVDTFDCLQALAVDESVDANTFLATVYPNPVADVLYVQIDKPMADLQLRMFDALGHLVWSENGNKNRFELNCDQLSSGIYTLNITMGAQHFSQKIVVSR